MRYVSVAMVTDFDCWHEAEGSVEVTDIIKVLHENASNAKLLVKSFVEITKKVADGLHKLGVNKGDVIGVMAWNNHSHLEVWYGIPGVGAVNHNLKPKVIF